jgi:LytS/YehU family sensor histidine kinase
MSRRFPLTGPRRVAHLAAHTVAAVAFIAVGIAVAVVYQFGVLSPAGAGAFGYGESFLASVAQHLGSFLIVYACIVAAQHAARFSEELQERRIEAANLETLLAQAQITALKTQLQPHFLFNTLHAIGVLVREDPPAATRMVARLGDLLRLSLARNGEHEVPLARELEFVRLYLEIEQTRFQDRLRVSYDVDPAALGAAVPDMLLQPLVENAIKHGISKRAGPGRIELSAHRTDGTLELRVRDDGPGYAPSPRSSHGNGNGGGIGLSATRARLLELYGDAQRLDVSGAPGGGCQVAITLPFRTTESAANG